MMHPRFSAYLGNAHRQALSREAAQTALADDANPATGGIWSAAALMVADVLLKVGKRLHAHYSRKRLAHVHEARCAIESMRHCDGVPCERAA